MRSFGLTLWAIGIAAVLSLLLAPLELLRPPQLAMGDTAFRMLALVNPLLLVSAAVLAGCLTAPSIGLDAPLLRAWIAGGDWASSLRRQFGPALLGGLASVFVIIGYSRFSAGWFTGEVAAFQMPLFTKLLYGGVAEEIIVRWGLMSLAAWGLWKLGVGRHASIVAAAILSAGLFAAGHLPVLSLLAPQATGVMIVAVLIGNFLPGLIFGLLFWRRGLEAAIMAHALAHLLSTPALAIIAR